MGAMSSLPVNTASCLDFSSSLKWKSSDGALEGEVLRLFDLMRTRLLRYAMSFGITLQDGEDIVQETFLALFHHLRGGRSASNIDGWLFRVTHNLALKRRMAMRSEIAVRVTKDIQTADPRPDPEEHTLFGERHARLHSVLQALPIEDQACLRLRAEGLRYREISKIVGISLGGVSASLSRSLARLEQADRR